MGIKHGFAALFYDQDTTTSVITAATADDRKVEGG